MTSQMLYSTSWRTSGFGFPAFGRSRSGFQTVLQERDLRKNWRVAGRGLQR